MARPRKAEARDTRRDILDAALDLFAVGGYFGSSMRQIAQAVGVRESALYHHFESKQAIFEGLLAELGPAKVQRLAQLDVDLVSAKLGTEGLLRMLIELVIAEWATPKEQKLLRIILSEGPRLGTEGLFHPRVFMERGRTQLTRLFSEMVRLKRIPKVSPEAAALGFMGPLIALRLMYLTLPGGPPDLKGMKREAEAHLKHFMRSIK
jgi:AcrR family transcriptional regulator